MQQIRRVLVTAHVSWLRFEHDSISPTEICWKQGISPDKEIHLSSFSGAKLAVSSDICGGQVPILGVKNMWKILETVPWHRVVLESEENSPFVKSRCENPWKWKFLLGNFLQKQLTTKQRIPCSCCCSCCRLRYCFGTFTNTTWSNVWLKSIDPTSPW